MIFQIPVQIEDPLSLWKCSSPNDPSSKVSTYICKCMLDKWLSRQMSNIRWVVFLLCLRDFKDYQCSQLPRPYLYSWLHSQVSGLSVHLSVGSPCGLFGHYLPFQVFNMRPLKSPPSCPTLYQLGLFSLTSDRQRIPSIVFFSQAKNPGTIRFTFLCPPADSDIELCVMYHPPCWYPPPHRFSLQQPKWSWDNVSCIVHSSKMFLRPYTLTTNKCIPWSVLTVWRAQFIVMSLIKIITYWPPACVGHICFANTVAIARTPQTSLFLSPPVCTLGLLLMLPKYGRLCAAVLP